MLDGEPGRARSVHRGHMPELEIDSPTELRKDSLPREQAPQEILGGQELLRDPDYIARVTAEP
jgi:hypothetical protein